MEGGGGILPMLPDVAVFVLISLQTRVFLLSKLRSVALHDTQEKLKTVAFYRYRQEKCAVCAHCACRSSLCFFPPFFFGP